VGPNYTDNKCVYNRLVLKSSGLNSEKSSIIDNPVHCLVFKHLLVFVPTYLKMSSQYIRAM